MAHVAGLQAEYGPQMCFVFRHFPLPPKLHPNAWLASEAAVGAGEQGRFWEMHQLLFDSQLALERLDLLNYAGWVGVDTDEFQRHLDAHTFRERVQRDRASGRRSGVRQLPAFFLNGMALARTRSLADLSRGVAAVLRSVTSDGSAS
jgi:predicted DsbA family dithiol-disulfide isomerase